MKKKSEKHLVFSDFFVIFALELLTKNILNKTIMMNFKCNCCVGINY